MDQNANCKKIYKVGIFADLPHILYYKGFKENRHFKKIKKILKME